LFPKHYLVSRQDKGDNMAARFPTSVKSFTNPTASNKLSIPSHAQQHEEVNDEVTAIEDYILTHGGIEGWINVKGYGATGDGITDDTTAIQDAIDFATSEGSGRIYFPPGEYLISSISINQTDIHLIGSGRTITTIQTTAAANTAIVVASTKSVEHLYIADLTIKGTSSNLGGISFGTIAPSYYVAFCKLERVEIRNFTKSSAYGVSFIRTQEMDFRNCNILANYYNVLFPSGAINTSTTFSGFAGYLGLSTKNAVYIDAAITAIDVITFRDIVFESDSEESIKSPAGASFMMLIDNCYFEGSNIATTAAAIIDIAGSSTAYKSVSLVMRNCRWHSPAAPAKAVKTDYVYGFYTNNIGMMEEGMTTSANSMSKFHNNFVSPSASSYKSIYAALLGQVHTDDRDIATNARYIQGGFQLSGNSIFGGASTETYTMTGRLILRTAASDPQHVTPGSRPAGSVGELVNYAGKMYFCTNAATPTWEIITSA
jgi:hypothetical protein